ncbi:MAG: hypothetical protein IJZ90_03545, partial [Clostridia bacterium]|nr:hypothetical protein [Clostridia bacterium]
MNLKTLKRFGSFTAAFVLMVTCLTGCTEGIFKKGVDSISETAQPSDGTAAQSEADSANDAAATEDYVAMMEGNPIYASDFYSCLYTAFSEVYYSSDIEYEDGATDDEKYEILLNYLEQKPEDSEKTYFEIAVDRALEICHTYHISGFLGEEKELLTDEDIESVITALDKTATDGAEYYGVSRDEFMTYYYGMNVNESKRYAILMSYAEKYMDYWLESNGYVLDAEDPAKPEEPGEDASESERDEYETALADYEIALAEYEKTVS